MSVYSIHRKKVSHDLLEGEVIAIHFETGAYYSLRGTATQLWEKLASPISPERLATFFTGDSQVVTDQVRIFLDDLTKDDLLIKEEATDTGPNGTGEWGSFVEPQVEKYTDMQDLLLADPIHDVEPGAGWPYLKPDDEA
jgi:hypothetical protein